MPDSYLKLSSELLSFIALHAASPRSAPLSTGGFAVLRVAGAMGAWTVSVQIYSAVETPIGAPVTVAQSVPTIDTQIATLDAGRFVVTWTNGSNLLAKIYDATGTAITSFTATSSFSTPGPTISLSDGGFLMVWSTTAAGHPAHVQRYDSSGVAVGSAFEFAGGIGDVAELAGGGYVFTWAQSNTIFAEQFTAAGVAIGPAFQVNAAVPGSRSDAHVATLASGGYVVVWTDSSGTGGDASSNAVHAQVYDAAGAEVSADFVVNTITAGSQSDPEVVALPSGGFFVAWTDGSGAAGGASDDIRGQVFDDDGNRVGDELLVNTTTPSSQLGPTLSVSADGVITVGWTDLSGVANGNPEADGRVQQLVPVTLAVDTYNASAEIPLTTVELPVEPLLTPLAGGGFAAVWETGGQGGSVGSTRTQVFDAIGHAIGPVTILADPTANNGTSGSAIAGLAGGGYVVAWEDDGPGVQSSLASLDIRAEIFDASGNPVGGSFLVNTTTTNGQLMPAAAGLAGGSFVIVWKDESATGGDTSSGAIRAQIFTAGGAAAGSEFLVNTTTAGDQFTPAVTALSNGNFLVSWSTNASNSAMHGQMYTAAGATVGSELVFPVGTFSAIAELSGGGFVLTYQAKDFGGNQDVKAQLYDASGSAVGTPITVNTTQASDQLRPEAAGLAGGGFIVTWWDAYSPQGSAVHSIRAQIFDSVGRPVGGELTLSSDSAGIGPSIMHLGSDLVVAWSNGNAIEARILTPSTGQPFVEDDAVGTDNITTLAGNVFADNGAGSDSLPLGNQVRVSSVNGVAADVGHQIMLASGALLTINADGTFAYDPNDRFDSLSGAATATDSFSYGTPGGPSGTVTVTISAFTPGPGIISGTSGEDHLIGTASPETILGLDGDDWLYGLGGNDILRGSAGHDILVGGAGADHMVGGLGDDWYNVDDAGDVVAESVGEGFDQVYTSVSYALAAGVEVEILSTNDYAATIAIDLTGNEFSQTLYGNAGANVLNGGGGLDYLFGLGGNDTLIGGTDGDYMYGGTGDDLYIVDNAGDQVIEAVGEGSSDQVNTSVSYALAAGAEVETLSVDDFAATTAINLTGNEFGQTLHGNAGVNVLNGGGGADDLIGGAGKDTLIGGTGADVMEGGTGNDLYIVDDAGDQVIEASGPDFDQIYTSVSYTLGDGVAVEVLSVSDFALTTPIDLTGNEFSQQIFGNAGDNYLDAKNGVDAMFGRGGADTFAFTTTLGGVNVDTIGDFVSGTDKIALDDGIFSALGVGALSASAFVTGTAALDADDRIIYDSATGKLYYDADGNGAGAQIQFATLQGHPALIASDFQVI